MKSKVLFIHDTYFYEDEDANFYSEHIDNSILDKYLYLGDFVTFLGRKKELNNKKKLSDKLSALDRNLSDLIALPSIRQHKNYFKNLTIVKTKIKKAVLAHDIIVPRVPSAFSTIAIKYAKKYKKPIIAEVVGCTYDAYWNYGFKGKIIAPYFYFVQKKTIKNLPYVIYVTDKFLQKRYPNQGANKNCSDVILNSIDDSILEKRVAKINGLKSIQELKIATIAGLDVPYKGHRYVIRAISRTKNSNYTYFVVGNGTGEAIRSMAKTNKVLDKVNIVGPIKHSEIFEFLDKMDIYIQPSRTEGLPRALVEAMSRGLPAIGTKVGGIPELLEDEFLFKKGNVNEIVAILSNLDKEKLKKQAIINFEKSKGYFVDSINERRLKFYFKFLKENSLPIPGKLSNQLKTFDK